MYSSAQIDAIGLVWKPGIDAERRVDISRQSLCLVNRLQLLHIRAVQLDQLAILVDARRSNRFGEHGGPAGDCSQIY
jgi:hypothetical protein